MGFLLLWRIKMCDRHLRHVAGGIMCNYGKCIPSRVVRLKLEGSLVSLEMASIKCFSDRNTIIFL